MPLLDFRCRTCGSVVEFYRGINSESVPSHCNFDMEQVHLAPPVGMVRGEIHYKCMATGQGVTSMRQRRYIMDKHDLCDLSDFNVHKYVEKNNAKREKLRAEAEAAMQECTTLPTGQTIHDFTPETA